MSFTFNDSFLGNPLNVGLHWSEFCGNDVVEGGMRGTGTPLPEPGSLLLLVFGLGALGVYRKRAIRE